MKVGLLTVELEQLEGSILQSIMIMKDIKDYID